MSIDLTGWSVRCYGAEWLTNHRGRRNRETDLCVDSDGDLCVEVADEDGSSRAYIPLPVLANHLRLLGWTVTPPSEEPE